MTRAPIPPLPDDVEILDAVHDLALRLRGGRSFPHIRTQDWLDLPDADKVASLLPLALAWLTEDPRREQLAAMKEVSRAIHSAVPRGYWSRLAAAPSRADIEARRYPWPSQQAIRAAQRAS